MEEIIARTYEILERIGAGGGGVVYLANHLRLNKKVVLKADKRKITTRPDLLRREVDVLKNLSHPHIPQVYDFFVENDVVYTVMDYVEGESLAQLLHRGEIFSQAQVIQWGIQLLDALRYLHSPIHGNPPKGYVHSDIKPANIMKKPNGQIVLIDFNIALALGEQNVVGYSEGYSSPEHYGLDFSSGYDADLSTLILSENEETVIETDTDSTMLKPVRRVIPDARSDIYSVGAVLYHLASGIRPNKNALEVIPLSQESFSPLFVQIISKAMDPNPELRYQTAEDMLVAFLNIRRLDPRWLKLKKVRRIAYAASVFFILAGVSSAFVGLKRMQIEEKWLKLAEYSENAAEEGDIASAISYALDALPDQSGIFIPTILPEAEMALADATGAYDLSDGFKDYAVMSLPSAPLAMDISPDGNIAACIVSGKLIVFSTQKAEVLLEEGADPSALSEIHFIDSHTLIFAGINGLTAYDIERKKALWVGEKATSISLSADKKMVAAIYKDEPHAKIYEIDSGKESYTLNFKNRKQSVTANDIFLNPKDNLFALNQDGSFLAVSFEDGSLSVFPAAQPEDEIIIFDPGSGYTHFEGGFSGQYFAFTAADRSGSVFAVVDLESGEQAGGFQSEDRFSTWADEDGIYLVQDYIAVKLDPVTGDQQPIVNTNLSIDRIFHGKKHTVMSSGNQLLFFDKNALRVSEKEKQFPVDMVALSGDFAIAGSSDEPSIWILKYENHEEKELFSYDPFYGHAESRLSADQKSVMQFSYDSFRIYDRNGKTIAEVSIPDADQVYDQQYRRKDGDSYLEVTYNDGMVHIYDASNGKLRSTEQSEKPDASLYEEFLTDKYRISSPLHGTPEVFEKDTGKKVCDLSEDAYLTYVTQAGEYIVAQYTPVQGEDYGLLLDADCNEIARLPNLCDVMDETLIFDYPTGNLRKTNILGIEELKNLAKEMEENKK